MGVMVCGFVSLIMPESDAPVEDMLLDETWRIVYGSTLILQLLGTLFIFFFMKYPSLNQLVADDKKDIAIGEIKKIY
jgi:hypothetical protein